MAAVAGAARTTVKITSPQACGKGNICVVGNVSGLAADAVAANGEAVLIVDSIVNLPKRVNSIAVNPGTKLYGRHNDDKVNASSGNGYTVYIGDAVSGSAANSADTVGVWLGRSGA